MEWGGTLVVLATPPMYWSVPPMPAKVSVPDSLSSLLQHFRSCFSAPGYEVFTAMFTGFILRPVERTVCGMLTGAGLAGVWHHSRAHRFFANTRWDVREVGLILATLAVELLLPADAPILLAIDETLTRRRGPKVFGASWWHDGSAAGTTKIGYGNSWVVLAIVVTLPFCRRPIALPVLFALCVKGGRSKPDLGRDLLDEVAEAFPARTIHLVGDAAYGAGHFAGLGRNMTITTRARSNAVFHQPTPAASGKRGRPRLRGQRIGTPTDIARNATDNNAWVDTLINRYGTTITARTTEITCLWFGVWRTDPVRVILVKDSHRKATNQELRHRDRHHRHERVRRRDHRPVRIPVVHRSLLPRREKHHRRRRDSKPARKGSPTQRPLHIHGANHHRPVVHQQRQPRNANHRTPQKRPLVHDENRPIRHGHALRPPGHAHHSPY